MDEVKPINEDPWAKYKLMITEMQDSPRLNQAGVKFVKGCGRFLEFQGYLSLKQTATLTVIYEQWLEP